MEINLSKEVIETVYNSLRDSRHSLKWQVETTTKITPNRKEIAKHQLAEVEDALTVFEELMEYI